VGFKHEPSQCSRGRQGCAGKLGGVSRKKVHCLSAHRRTTIIFAWTLGKLSPRMYYLFASFAMRKLSAVEDARAIMTEGMESESGCWKRSECAKLLMKPGPPSMNSR
jgi:hypothetical protein